MAKLKKFTKRRMILYSKLMENRGENLWKLEDEFLLEVPCDIYYNCLDTEEVDIIVERIFRYYRGVGFPYYNLTDEEIKKEYAKFMRYDGELIEGDEIKQIMHGLSIVNSFFPNMWGVKCGEMRTPLEVFNDDELFRDAIRKRIRMSDCPLKPYGIRKALRIYSGTQSVSSFRPSVAKALVSELFDEGGLKVLDPCMGWGGRMLGFCSSSLVDKYEGYDASKETVLGLERLRDKMSSLGLIDKEVLVHHGAFEDAEIEGEFDLVMTSPPYFDIEKYSMDEEQSYIKYDEYDKWVDGFLRPLVEKSYDVLKPGGYLCLNVGMGLYEDTYKLMDEIFGVSGEYKMRLSQMCGRGIDKNRSKFKYEPIIVGRKFLKEC